jgi:serine/threonine protein kinase
MPDSSFRELPTVRVLADLVDRAADREETARAAPPAEDGEPKAALPISAPASYVPLSPLGHGSAGTVWLARDVELRREVALKIGTRAPTLGLIEEARVLARLEHAAIPPVYAVGRPRVPLAPPGVPAQPARRGLPPER